MAAKKPTPPKESPNKNNDKEWDKYYDDLKAYYDGQEGVKDSKKAAMADFNAAKRDTKNSEAASKVSAEDKSRIDSVFQKELGRKADTSAYATYSSVSNEDLISEIRRGVEYQQKAGNLLVIQNRDTARGTNAVYVIRDNEGGRALLNDKDWLKERVKIGDEVIKPKGYEDVSSGGDFDIFVEGKKQAITQEMLSQYPWLKQAGYSVGDDYNAFTKVKKPKSGLFNWVDDALGTNTARFVDKHVSDQVKFIMDPLGINSGFYTRNMARDSLEGGAKLFGTSEENVARGRAYANAAIDIGLMFVPGGAVIAAAKNTVANLNRYQAREIEGKQLFAKVGQDVALAYIGANAAKASNAAKFAEANKIATAANTAGTGATALTAVNTASKITSGVTAGLKTGGGLAAARFAVSYGANKIGGMDSSSAFREAAWSTAGSQTGQLSTVFRLATSNTARNQLRDPNTGELNPMAVASTAASVGSGFYSLRQQGGGSIWSGLKNNMSWSNWNPVAGVGAIAGGANELYSTLAGSSTSNLQKPYADPTVAAGEEFYGSDISSSSSATRYTTADLVTTPTGSNRGYTSAEYGGDPVRVSTSDGLYSIDVQQNWLPSLRGAGNLGRDLFNISVFGQREPTIRGQPAGFRRITAAGDLLRATGY